MAAISNSGTIRFEPYNAAPEGSCAICLTDFESQELNETETTKLAHAAGKIHHVFHQNCLKDFFYNRLSKDNSTPCPLCMGLADPSSVLPLSEFYARRQMNAARRALVIVGRLSMFLTVITGVSVITEVWHEKPLNPIDLEQSGMRGAELDIARIARLTLGFCCFLAAEITHARNRQ